MQPRERCQLEYPCGWRDDGRPEFELRSFEGVNAVDSFRALRVASRRGSMRIACYGSGTLSVADIDSILVEWQRDDWAADVVVVDYADILAPPKGVKDTLDQIDENWKGLRRISQVRNCLVVTATQSSATIY